MRSTDPRRPRWEESTSDFRIRIVRSFARTLTNDKGHE